MSDIKLGNTIRDAISGFTGIAIQRLEFMNGNVQYGVQPKGKEEGVYPDAMFIDHHTLDVVDEGVADRATPATETEILLGQKVKDKASGFVGIATHKATYINGCVSFGVMPEHRAGFGDKNANPQPSFIDHNRLEVVKDGLLNDAPRTEEIKSDEAPVKRPGGPATRVQRGL